MRSRHGVKGLTERSVYATFQPIGKDSSSQRAHHASNPLEETAVPAGSSSESSQAPHPRPRPRRSGLSRRAFLGRGAAAAAAFPSMAAFLEACSKNGGSGGASAAATSTFSVASPEHPVTWDIASDNKAIADGLTPEQGATVNIYTYTDYLDPQALKDFEKKYKQYDVKCTITTFEDTTEALGKIRSGGVQADIFNPSYDQMGKLVKGGLDRTAEPQLHPEHQQRLAELPEPVLRPGLALHDAVHGLHHGHRLADRQGQRGHRQAVEPVRRLLGRAVRQEAVGARRLPHDHGHGRDAQRLRHQHPEEGRADQDPAAAHPDEPDHDAQGQRHRLPGHPDRRRQPVPRVVRRRVQHGVLHAAGPERRRAALLVPGRPDQGRGRQRPVGDAEDDARTRS